VPLESEQLLQALSEKLMIIRLHISYPKLQRGIKNAIVEIPGAGEIASELRNAPSWQLLPREWKDRYQSIDTAARRYLRSQSIQPRTSGKTKSPLLVDLDIIPLHKAEEILISYDLKMRFAWELDNLVNPQKPIYHTDGDNEQYPAPNWNLAHATPAEHAEAFLKTLNIWEDEN